MKVIVREKVNIIATPEIKTFRISVDPINRRASIPETIGLMKGDIIAYRGNADPVRLPVGTTGKVLTADPTQPTGMRWADAAGSSGAKVTLKNASGAISAGTVMTVFGPTNEGREASKALYYTEGKLYIAADDALSGADVDCFCIPGSIVQVLVTGSCDVGDPLVVSSTAGIAEALPGGTPTVGIAQEEKSSNTTGLVTTLLVENKAIWASNVDSSSHVNGTAYEFCGGNDTDGLGDILPNVRAAKKGGHPCGVQANTQSNSESPTLLHTEPGSLATVVADSSKIVVGDWLVPSSTAGQVRNGNGYGIGYAMENKAAGSSGKIKVRLYPLTYGYSPRAWWLPAGISPTDVIAVWQFVDMASESAALTSIHEGTEYILAKSHNTITWNSASGITIPATSGAGLQNSDVHALYANLASAAFGFSSANTGNTDIAIGGTNLNWRRNLAIRGIGSGNETYYTNAISMNRSADNTAQKYAVKVAKGVLSGTWDSTTTYTELYLDGLKQTTTNGGGNLSSNSIWGTAGVIAQPSAGNNASFKVTAIALYSVQLTASQHLELAQAIANLGGLE